MIQNYKWPIGSEQPLNVKNDYSWRELGVIYRLIDENKVGLVIETGVHSGDFAAWMSTKCLFDNDFHYTGVALELECVSPSVRRILADVPQAFIVPGLSYSDAILGKMKKFIHNSFKPVLVFCNGANQQREFHEYMKVLRPGDVVVVSGFPVKFSLSNFTPYMKDEKLERIAGDFMLNTRFIAGVVL